MKNEEREDDEPVWFAESFVYWLRVWELVLSRTASEVRDHPGARAKIEAIAASRVSVDEQAAAEHVRYERREAWRRAHPPARTWDGQTIH